MTDLTGKLIRGYELCERVGEGGFGTIYRALQPGVGREVAVKVIRLEYANQPEFIRRFEAEAQLVARLEHPYIVPLYDFWREPDGAYLIMRYFSRSLQDSLRDQGVLTLSEAARLLDNAAAALMVAHRSNIIHRDIKPENIMLDADGNAYLTDFGIAWRTDGDQPFNPSRTFTGSLAYAAPEVFLNKPPTAASDIYSLGCVLHRALTNTPPIEGVALDDWINFHLSASFPADERIPEAVFKVLEKATAKQPDQRYSNALQMATEFRQAIFGSPISAPDVLKTLINPYKGLRAFEESDADDFFGRDALVDRLITRLHEPHPLKHFLGVVGPSGSGKSSLIKAGLLPALRRDQLSGAKDWFMIDFIPGDQPFEKLAAALLRVAVAPPNALLSRLQSSKDGLCQVLKHLLPPQQELLIVIDQFEELFTLVKEEAERALFLDALHHAVTSGCMRLLITLRADFYDRPLLYENFAELLRQRTEVVVPLTALELERTIVGPVERLGMKVDPRLITAITTDLRDEPGMLPLLQYALTEVFERRDGISLTLDGYKASGGVLKALGQRAEDLFIGLSAQQQDMARQLFLRLVTLGEGSEDTRRRVLVSELRSIVPDQPLRHILETYGKYRLLTFDHDPMTREPSIEVAHEALIREWSHLRAWLDSGRTDVRLQRVLSAACEEWIKTGRQKNFLLAGGRLSQFEEWRDQAQVALTQEEQEFLISSLAERDRQVQQETDRLARERTLEQRDRTRLRVITAILAVAAVLALFLMGIAFNRSEAAEEAQRESEQTALVSYETVLLSNSQLSLYRDNNTDLAIALALEAGKIGQLSALEYRVLSEAVYTPGTRRVFTGHNDRIYRIDLTADGRTAISGGRDNNVRVWDVTTGQEIRLLSGHTSPVLDVVFSPDEQLAVSTSLDKRAIIWNLNTGEIVHTLDSGEKPFMSAAFHPDGEILVTGSEDKTVKVWAVASGELLQTFAIDDPTTDTLEGHKGRIWGVTFSPDGKSIFSSGEDGYLLRWDTESGELIQQYEHPRWIYQTFFSPDGQTMAVVSFDSSIRVWDVESGTLKFTLNGHTASVYAAAFTPDAKHLLTTSMDKSVRVWDLTTGVEINRFASHTDRVYDIEMLPGGKQFITSSYDGTLRLWDFVTDDSVQFTGHTGIVYQLEFNPAGTRLLSVSADSTIKLWDTETHRLLRTFAPDNPDTEAVEGHADIVLSAAFSPDEKFILSSDYVSTIILWDAETGEVVRVFAPDDPETPLREGHDANLNVWNVAFALDGKTFFSAGFDKRILQWDIETGAVLRELTAHTDVPLTLQMLSDGRRMLSTSFDRTIILWDITTGEVLHQYKGHSDWVWDVALNADETRFLSASTDNTLILWDLATGAEIRRYFGHADGALTVDFRPDDLQAVSAGRDNLAILWDIASGEWLRKFPGHVGWIRTVAYSPVSNQFVTGGSDSVIRLWNIQSLEELTAWTLENRYIRELTCQERKIYRVEPYCEG